MSYLDIRDENNNLVLSTDEITCKVTKQYNLSIKNENNYTCDNKDVQLKVWTGNTYDDKPYSDYTGPLTLYNDYKSSDFIWVQLVSDTGLIDLLKNGTNVYIPKNGSQVDLRLIHTNVNNNKDNSGYFECYDEKGNLAWSVKSLTNTPVIIDYIDNTTIDVNKYTTIDLNKYGVDISRIYFTSSAFNNDPGTYGFCPSIIKNGSTIQISWSWSGVVFIGYMTEDL